MDERRLDALASRVDDLRDEVAALRSVPWTLAEHAKRFDRMREDALRGTDLEERRFQSVYQRLDGLVGDLRELRAELRSDFEQLETEQSHMMAALVQRRGNGNGKNGNGKTGPLNLLTLIIGAASGIGVPVAIAVYAALQSGGG